MSRVWNFFKGLPFFPISNQEVREIVYQLMDNWQEGIAYENYSDHSKSNFKAFLEYFEKNYLRSNAKFDPRFWATLNYYASCELERENTNNVSHGSSKAFN